MSEEIKKAALEYHERHPAGKIYTGISKPCESQRDLTLAYSPGVAWPCLEIHKDEQLSYKYTGRGNLVGVITNGTAVLGLGNIGPHAAKPVMEGKGLLFKKYADIDVFDIEMNSESIDAFIAAVKSLEPTFGGINLEDIKGPECFLIEEKLRNTMNIPVFHDDQHGTAIIATAAFFNAIELTNRDIKKTKVVFSGGGAAAIGCGRLFRKIGLDPKNIIMCDSQGVIYAGRTNGMNEYKAEFAVETKLRTLEEALNGADAFIGVSVANVLTPQMISKMAKDPIIFALANPDPEILPNIALQARPDAIVATGRSDFPNQVNNVLGFPFIFRGALDVAAKTVNDEMKLAAAKAIADLAKENVPEKVMKAYGKKEAYTFGRDYLIPKPVDPRVLLRVAPAVAKAAMDSGVARKKIDINEYTERLERIIGPTRRIIRAVRSDIKTFTQKAKRKPRIVMANGADLRVLRAVEQTTQDGEVDVILIGNEAQIHNTAREAGLMQLVDGLEVVDPEKDSRLEKYSDELFHIRQRRGVSKTGAEQLLANHSYFAAMMVRSGDADGMVNGLLEPYGSAVKPILEVIGVKRGQTLAGVYMITVKQKPYFFADCTINIEPDSEILCEIAIAAADVAKRFTKDPIRVAMLSYASFGASRHPLAKKVSDAVARIRARRPEITVEGEVQADVALNLELQKAEFPFSVLNGQANVLVFPDLGSANISYKILTNITDATATGPVLVGVNKSAHVLQRGATVDEVIGMIYLAAQDAVLR